MACSSSRPPDQIQQGENEQPHHVDQMPVQTGQFERRVVVLAIGSARDAKRQHGVDAYADEQMQRVETGNEVIQAVEQFLDLRVLAALVEVDAGNQVFDVVGVVLHAVDEQESAAQQGRAAEEQ